jgi:hypothetical protein
MSATDRQNRLLVAEDWKRVYQSFRNADFQSYDFDNLRRTMITYLRENYPEDFNDYIESTEYLALIDLIAFLGQNLSFRIDLNARENYLELAERRESVLRLARMLNYNPRRNQAANGLLKFTSVKTDEDIIDSNGTNLAGSTVQWNDSTNSNWYEQFIKVLNAALPVNGVFGRPNKLEDVAGISTEQYRFNGINTNVPVYSFEKTIEGAGTPFQVVSTDIENGSLLEEPPIPGNNFAFVYRDDGQGAGSTNSGFFAHFRQGTLQNGQFTITQPTENQTVAIDATNINNSDVWLYKLDSNGNEEEFWTKLDAIEGNNIIYNSINKGIRNVYSVLTRVDDRINLIFSDGVFGNLPKGSFRTYYRTSANRSMIITPASMRGITIRVPYLSKRGKVQTLTITLGLQYTVSNGDTSESNLSIKTNAPSTYYTQNRMITGEDYNVAPLAVSQDIVKVKSVNRTSSGISRYFDLIDATGKYSQTNLYGNDGVVYKEFIERKSSFSFSTQTDIEGTIINLIEPILRDRKIKHFYADRYPAVLVGDLGVYWNSVSEDTNTFTGYFDDIDDSIFSVGTATTNSLRYVESGSVIKFVTGDDNKCFDKNNNIVNRPVTNIGDKDYIWTKVIQVVGNGANLDADVYQGPITLSDKIPSGATVDKILPKLSQSVSDDLKVQIIDQVFAYNDFGLRYDTESREWRLIKNSNLNKQADFSTGFSGDLSNLNLDASWLLLFETAGETYTVTYRGLRYVFESDNEIRFYYDSNDKVYDNKTGKVVKDKISVLSINTRPDSLVPFAENFIWEILEEYRDGEGYVDSTKVEVTFADNDSDGTLDDPELFKNIVEPEVNTIDKLIVLEKYFTEAGTEDFRYVDYEAAGIRLFETEVGALPAAPGPLSAYENGDVFYFRDTNTFKYLNASIPEFVVTADYKAFLGRDNLKFQYVHVADSNTRIDPSASNLIDVYMLTKNYDTSYRLYLDGQASQRPLPPSSDELFRLYGSEINKIKSISDEVVYHPVKYKVLFGPQANSDLQSTFKLVKNPDLVLNDNDVKTRVIDAVNQYFALENWEFGDTFYFQELATYVMNRLAPDLVTIVIVPKQTKQTFGSLFEIRCEADEIFINGATVDQVEIIDEITASRLNADGNVITSSAITNSTGIQSS